MSKELRDKNGKLRAIWDSNSRRITIRTNGPTGKMDVTFTLNSEDDVSVTETLVGEKKKSK